MLVDVKFSLPEGWDTLFVDDGNGGLSGVGDAKDFTISRIAPGVYQGSFFRHLLKDAVEGVRIAPWADSPVGYLEPSPGEYIWLYGVADTIDEIMEHGSYFQESPFPFVLHLHDVYWEDQPPHDGFRYHKWGEYIGKRETHEYLVDDTGVEKVIVFQFYPLEEIV